MLSRSTQYMDKTTYFWILYLQSMSIQWEKNIVLLDFIYSLIYNNKLCKTMYKSWIKKQIIVCTFCTYNIHSIFIKLQPTYPIKRKDSMKKMTNWLKIRYTYVYLIISHGMLIFFLKRPPVTSVCQLKGICKLNIWHFFRKLNLT